MKEIPLTQDKVALVDDADYEAVMQHKWSAHQSQPGRWYARGKVAGSKRWVYLHRWLLGLPETKVDHKDGQTLRCGRDNLRVASDTQNSANSRKRRDTTSIYKGVSRTGGGSWRAYVGIRGKYVGLGTFEWEVSAAHAYDKKALELWGEFAKPNFPIETLSPEDSGILIVGYGRSGKDAAGAFLHGQGPLKYSGSFSWFALPFVARQLRIPCQWAWERRHENRDFWFRFCNVLRERDPLFLARLALKAGNVVTGLRDRVEMDAAKASGLFSSILWIERPEIPVDPTVKFTREDCTDVIQNDGTLEEFRERVLGWAQVKGYIQK